MVILMFFVQEPVHGESTGTAPACVLLHPLEDVIVDTGRATCSPKRAIRHGPSLMIENSIK
jgi:hypothetical protein